jgi:ribosomal protein S18 acetylase RimI-like enzyme
MAVHVRVADVTDAHELAVVAAQTFPLACPPSSTPANIDAFIEAQLSVERFAKYIGDPDSVVLAAHLDRRIIGYCMLIRGVPEDDADVQRAVTARPSVELSKMYVLPENHSTGASAALMVAALDRVAAMSAKSVWLGVNQENIRAQRFYAKYGFVKTGTKAFQLGGVVENDYVMVRSI